MHPAGVRVRPPTAAGPAGGGRGEHQLQPGRAPPGVRPPSGPQHLLLYTGGVTANFFAYMSCRVPVLGEISFLQTFRWNESLVNFLVP
jgi:hypothetical protein